MPKGMAQHRFCLGKNPGVHGDPSGAHCPVQRDDTLSDVQMPEWTCKNLVAGGDWPDKMQGTGASTARLIASSKTGWGHGLGPPVDRRLDAPIARPATRPAGLQRHASATPKPRGSGSNVSRPSGAVGCPVPTTSRQPAARREPEHRLVLEPITLMTVAARTGRICGKLASRVICRPGLAAIRRASASRLINRR